MAGGQDMVLPIVAIEHDKQFPNASVLYGTIAADIQHPPKWLDDNRHLQDCSAKFCN